MTYEKQLSNNPDLPEMIAGSTGMYVVSAEDAVKMGMQVFKTFLAKIRETAEKAELSVKIEPIEHKLFVWWFPATQEVDFASEPGETTTFVQDLVQHISVTEEGSIQAERKLLFAPGGPQNMEELVEVFKVMSMILHNVIEVKDSLANEYLEISWRPVNETLADDSTATPI